MIKRFRFHRGYFIWAVLLFLLEAAIAAFLHDKIVRPYIGDALVVVLVYCGWMAFFNTRLLPTCIGVLLFAYSMEVLQYINIVELVGGRRNTVTHVLMGSYFSWLDMLMYTLGVVAVLVVEKRREATALSKNKFVR